MALDDEDSRQLFDLISRMLEYEPSQRISLLEALDHPFFASLPEEYKLHVQLQRQGSACSREHSLSR